MDYVAAGVARAGRTSPEAVLEAVESFGQDVGQWLKVAGGDKAAITEQCAWCFLQMARGL